MIVIKAMQRILNFYDNFLIVCFCEYLNHSQQYIQITVTQFGMRICRIPWQTILFGSAGCMQGQACPEWLQVSKDSYQTCKLASASVWFPNRLGAADRICQMWTIVRQYGDSRLAPQSSFHMLADETCLRGYHFNIILLMLWSRPPNSKNLKSCRQLQDEQAQIQILEVS